MLTARLGELSCHQAKSQLHEEKLSPALQSLKKKIKPASLSDVPNFRRKVGNPGLTWVISAPHHHLLLQRNMCCSSGSQCVGCFLCLKFSLRSRKTISKASYGLVLRHTHILSHRWRHSVIAEESKKVAHLLGITQGKKFFLMFK